MLNIFLALCYNNPMENSQKLRIAMVCDPVTDMIAGSVVSTLRFAQLLRKKGHEIIFLAAKSINNPENNTYQGFKVYRFPAILLPKSEKQFYISLPSTHNIKTILKTEKIDIVHLFVPTPSAYVSILAARALGIKILMHSHTQPENIFLHLPKFLAYGKINKIFYRYLYWLYQQADAIVYPSEFAEKLFASINPKIKHEVISNGVDTTRFTKLNPESFLKKYNLSRNYKYLLFVGRLHPEKNIETLLRAFPAIIKQAPETRLLIVGAGHLDQKLKQLAQELGSAKQTLFLGRLSDEEVIQAYNAADIFILPSLAELEGMVVLEAMACGKPLLIADAENSASPYFVKNNGFLFKPLDSADLACQALKLLTNDALRENMGQVSYVLSKNYDVNNSVNRLTEIYYSLLK